MLEKETILQTLEKELKPMSHIYAMWLEGSNGTEDGDTFSDLDIVLDVEDGFEEHTFESLERILTTLGALDLNYIREPHHPYLRDRVFHLANTSETLFLDVSIQSHSRDFSFIKENESEQPRIIFDKKDVIKFTSYDQNELQSHLEKRLYHLENTIKQKARVEKYIKRGKTIEAIGYYHKYILEPLVELLRIKYRPINHDYFIVSLSKHLPVENVSRLEPLFLIQSLSDLEKKVNTAVEWFDHELREIKLVIVSRDLV